jgi:uncharacterized protein YdhG (YjbR/CyaY superfamily)
MKKVVSNSGDKKSGPAKDIDSYLRTVPPDARAMLEKLRKTIKAAAPKAEEVISYRMPAFKYHGLLVFFAAFKNHCSFFVGSKSIAKTFSKELKPFDTDAGTIRFTVEKQLPATLVKKIVKARMKENEERQKGKQVR